jgi:hypothetical protein
MLPWACPVYVVANGELGPVIEHPGPGDELARDADGPVTWSIKELDPDKYPVTHVRGGSMSASDEYAMAYQLEDIFRPRYVFSKKQRRRMKKMIRWLQKWQHEEPEKSLRLRQAMAVARMKLWVLQKWELQDEE